MKFIELADYFERLERTSKRLEMFTILSELFKRAAPQEIDKIVYLCEERLLPPFKGLVIGMAEKLIERAIAKAAQQSEAEVRRLHKELGDPGLVAEELLAKQKGKKPLDVLEAYDELVQLAQTSGGGSIDKKINLLADLLGRGTPKEARYITRFVLGRLRLGIGDPTILEALSIAVAGDRSLKPELERAYNLCSDLGLVAKTLFTKGIKGVSHLEVRVGNPIRPALAERLSSAEAIVKKLGKCSVEAKYDGLRAAVHKKGDEVEIFSRNQDRTTHMFPDIVEGVRRQIRAEDAIFEGEALAFNEETGELLPFQVTAQRKRKHNIEEMAKGFPLVLFVFDLLYVDGEDYTKRPYSERREKLEKILKPGPRIKLADRIITDDPEEISKFFDKNIELGLEGILAKKLDAPYQAGARNFNWIKLKRSYKGELSDTVDVVLVGYFKGRGMRAKFGIGALLAAVYDEASDAFKTVAKIGSGLTEENWVRVKKLLDDVKVEHQPARVESLITPDVWAEPKYVFTVLADEITKSPLHTCGKVDDEPGYALRFPRIVGWIREDKKPEDANTVKEIIDLFKLQRKIKPAG
jgi:DNA ligase-1